MGVGVAHLLALKSQLFSVSVIQLLQAVLFEKQVFAKMVKPMILPHGNDSVQVGFNTLSVGWEQVCLGWLLSSILYYGFHGCVYGVELVEWVYVWHITSVQDVIDVFQEWFRFDLQYIDAAIS